MGRIRRKKGIWQADYVWKGERYRDGFYRLSSAEIRLKNRDRLCPADILGKNYTEEQNRKYLEECKQMAERKKTIGRRKCKVQQTRAGAGVVYLVSMENTPYVKIGYSGNIQKRRRALSTGSPEPVRIVCEIECSREYEKLLHKQFEKYRKNGEWFLDSEGVITKYISAIESGELSLLEVAA
jgi:hypothetical protein